MRPSILSIGELFNLAIRQRFGLVPRGKTPEQYLAPKGTRLVAFTTDGANRYRTETEAYEASWRRGRPTAHPVPVFRVVHA